MKKQLFLIVLLAFSISGYGQFNFDGGISLLTSNSLKQNFSYQSGTNTIYESSEMSAIAFGVLLYPRYQFTEIGNFGLGIGSPSNLAFEGSASSTGESSLSFLLDVNLTADFLGGSFNQAGDADGIGYYAGIGLGYTTTTNAGVSSYTSSSSASDLYNGVDIVSYDGTAAEFDKYHKTATASLFIHAGVGNFSLGNYIKRLGLRAGIKPSFSSSRLSYYTISVFKTFGDR